jgi:hypothetical protein
MFFKVFGAWKHNQVDQLMYIFGLNYKYLKIYHEIIIHVIWLGIKIEVNMFFDFIFKNIW